MTEVSSFECIFTVSQYGFSFAQGGYIRISYQVPEDLTGYLIESELSEVLYELSIPEFILFKNGEPVEASNYDTYLRDLQSPYLLFVELPATVKDIIELEYTQDNIRYCSSPYKIPEPNSPSNTPKPTEKPDSSDPPQPTDKPPNPDQPNPTSPPPNPPTTSTPKPTPTPTEIIFQP